MIEFIKTFFSVAAATIGIAVGGLFFLVVVLVVSPWFWLAVIAYVLVTRL